MNELELLVPGMSCDHCVRAISTEVSDVPGVTAVTVDLSTKIVQVRGTAEPAAVCAAIGEAGNEVQS